MITILVVEDEEYARESLVKQITECNVGEQFHIIVAVNGAQGYELYCEKEPELVMTDIRMPKMDGLELIKAIKGRNREAAVVMLSAYSDFEYARTALTYGASDYLLKPIEDEKLNDCLNKFLNNSQSLKRETMITGQDIITRYIIHSIRNHDISDFLGSSMFQKIFPSYQVLVFYVYGTCHLNRENILEKLEGHFNKEIWTKFRLIQVENRLWSMVFQAEKDSVFMARKLLKALTQNGYDACVGIGGEYHKPEDLWIAFQEAAWTLEYKILTLDKIITWEQTKSWDTIAYYLPKTKELQLKAALEDRNTRKTEYLIQELFEEVRQLGKVERECLELLFSHLTVILRGALQTISSGEDTFRKSKASIMDFSSLQELEQYLVKIGINICELYKKEQKGGGKDVVAAMMEYAQNHYSHDITVKQMAEKILFMNPDYLSHIFAEKMGVSFSFWLRSLRITYAKKYLQDSSLTVTEVAGMSGYNDTSQFIRIFKQETGKTPKKYRDMIQHMD